MGNNTVAQKYVAAVFGFCLLAWFGISANAATITWTNLNGGAWSVAANWSSHVVPGTFDDVLITSAGTYTVTMDVSPTISSLTLGGASGQQTLTNANKILTVSHASVVNPTGILGMNSSSINGTGSLSIGGAVHWNGGASGSGFLMTVQSGAVLNIDSSVTFAGVVTNLGTVNWLAGNVSLNTNGPTITGEFWNQAGALFDIQCSQNLSYSATPAIFHNAGTVRREIVGGTTLFNVFLDNSGATQSKAGVILISGGSNLGGIFQADNGAGINFSGGSFVLSSPPNFQGPGTVQFTAGNMTLDHFTGTFTLNGITLAGQNTVAATGTINLNGSNLGSGATLTVSSNAVLNLQSSTSFAGVVTNLGTVNWLAGNVNLNTNGPTVTGEFWNQAGALFDIQCSQNLSYAAAPAIFHNAGTVRREIVGGTTLFNVFLDNSGAIQSKAGVILISSGSNLSGVFQADSGAGINFNGGSFVLSSPPNFQGPGAVQFTAGNMTLNHFTGTFTLNGITMVGQNTVAATGTINLNGSNLGSGATLTVLSNAVLNLQSFISFAGLVTNLGTVNWLAGNVNINTNGPTVTGEFWNQADALFDIQCNQNLSSSATPAIFHNAGTVRREIASGTTLFNVFLDNSGTIQSKAGTILISGGSNLGGVFQADSGAGINFSGGSFVLSSPPNFQGPGTVQFTAGNMTLNHFTGTLTLDGIVLAGQNTVAATGTINLNGSNLGSGATLTVLSNAVLNLQSSTSFAGAVTNLGTVNWLAGNVNINTNGPTITGVFWNQPGALFDIQCNQNLSPIASPANFNNLGTMRKSSGSGSTAVGVNLNNVGTLQAQIGVITVQGPYTETPASTLAVSLSGSSPGTGFGKIQFTTAPTFAGKFVLNTLNGYRPNPGDSFQVISYPSFTGGFTSFNGLDLGGGLQLTPQMSATSLTLAASGHVPAISRISLSGTNVVLNCANGLSGGTYVALTSTNLSKPLAQWSPVATNVLVADGNFSITVTNSVNPVVRQRYFVIQLQ